jgi:glycosyltransferase involved in cell wall biosynthesis
VRYAVLIHDVLPLTHPHYWNPVERAVKRSAFLSLRHSKAHLFTSNQHNAHEIRRLLGRDAETVPFGCGQLTDAEADSALHSSLSIPGDTLVYVGALEPRKEVLFLLDLYEQFRRLGASLRLTLVGQGRGAYASLVEDRIATSQFRHDIKVVRSASRRTALQLIARARVLVVPSAAEGFGLPVVEAIALGTPVVAGRLPAIKSWADDSVTYAGVGVEEWVDAIALACEMSEVERRRRQTAVRTHRWRNCAAAMFDF